MRALISVIGLVPLIVFWTMKLTSTEIPEWSIALPAFSTGVFISLVLTMGIKC